ncbi:helix-turn-helix domain-containing protein [Kangiella sp. HZ709]|uniref:helix-turn-helix domain-containing protein n=1 Tax=Kangiella sp. HZ709 TaxID=2666328 RepID=UPI00351B3355
MSGLSIRTIQRVESGQSASLETLKSLASVFETDISKFTEEITVIDKQSEKWQSQPTWLKFLFFGVQSRKVALAIELSFLVVAVALWIFVEPSYPTILALIAAYLNCLLVRHADNKSLWDI